MLGQEERRVDRHTEQLGGNMETMETENRLFLFAVLGVDSACAMAPHQRIKKNQNPHNIMAQLSSEMFTSMHAFAMKR